MTVAENSNPGISRRESREPYSGYYMRDVPEHDGELTETGPGTPMGEYMRRHWQPVCLSKQLADLPVGLKVLHEDLVAFRDKSGEVGVLHRHCSHRGTSLEYGIVSEHGIRCCYHGWLFGVDGTILETPGEPPNSNLKNSFRHGSYPALERDGLVFAYLGPPDERPAFPERETFGRDDIEKVPFLVNHGNNWLQTYENMMDPVHSVFLHSRMTGLQLSQAFGELPHVEYDETHNGGGIVYISKRRLPNDKVWVRHVHHRFPNEAHFGTLFDIGGEEVLFQRVYVTRWIVPHDDTSCSFYGWRFFDKGLPGGDRSRVGINTIDFDGQAESPDFETKQRSPGDWEAQAGQRPIAIHALEHRASTDAGVTLLRQLLRQAVRCETPSAWPPESDIGSRATEVKRTNPRHTYAQDSVLTVPQEADPQEDWKLLGAIGRQVTGVLYEADALNGTVRDAFIIEKLHELNAG